MSCIYKYKGKDYTKDEFYSLVRTTMVQPRTVQKTIDKSNDIDFLLPDASDVLVDTEKVRKKRIEKDIIQTKDALKQNKDLATLKLLTARLGNLKEMLEGSKSNVASG